MKQLHIDEYFPPLYGSIIRIPADVVVYRGYSRKYPVLSERPAFFGTPSVAKGYAALSDSELGAFVTTRELRLLDYRFMKVILRQLLDEVTKTTKLAKEDSRTISSLIVSFGLTSLSHQIMLLQNNFPKEYIDSTPGFASVLQSYRGPTLIEQPGARIGETTNDAVSMGFLQSIFHGEVDGFLSPQLAAPFHVENGGILPPELILFNPLKSGIKQIPINYYLEDISVKELIIHTHPIVTITAKNVSTNLFISKGGASATGHSLDLIEKEILAGNKVIQRGFLLGSRVGKKWKMKDTIISYILPPVPHYRGGALYRDDAGLKI